jgi:lipoprotein-anchoring transpeptidase ErfK/SrfK
MISTIKAAGAGVALALAVASPAFASNFELIDRMSSSSSVFTFRPFGPPAAEPPAGDRPVVTIGAPGQTVVASTQPQQSFWSLFGGNQQGVYDPAERVWRLYDPSLRQASRTNPVPREEIAYPTTEPRGTIIVSTDERRLYLVLGNGRALRYGIGVGRDGFTWRGVKTVTRMAEWPDWRPPEQMLRRRPDLPRFMPGGPSNPLGARALYLGSTLYRIHGSNEPHTIGQAVSSGCFRMTNEDVAHLYAQVRVGTRVIVR